MKVFRCSFVRAGRKKKELNAKYFTAEDAENTENFFRTLELFPRPAFCFFWSLTFRKSLAERGHYTKTVSTAQNPPKANKPSKGGQAIQPVNS